MKNIWLCIIWGLLVSVSLTAQNGKITLPETTLQNIIKAKLEAGEFTFGQNINIDFSIKSDIPLTGTPK